MMKDYNSKYKVSQFQYACMHIKMLSVLLSITFRNSSFSHILYFGQDFLLDIMDYVVIMFYHNDCKKALGPS